MLRDGRKLLFFSGLVLIIGFALVYPTLLKPGDTEPTPGLEEPKGVLFFDSCRDYCQDRFEHPAPIPDSRCLYGKLDFLYCGRCDRGLLCEDGKRICMRYRRVCR